MSDDEVAALYSAQLDLAAVPSWYVPTVHELIECRLCDQQYGAPPVDQALDLYANDACPGCVAKYRKSQS